MASFRPVDFNECTPKAICGADSANPGLIYYPGQPCFNAEAWNPERCACEDPCCLQSYLEIYYEPSTVDHWFCSSPAYPDGYTWSFGIRSQPFLEASAPQNPTYSPENYADGDPFKLCGNMSNYGVGFTMDIITKCDGEPGPSDVPYGGAIGWGMRAMQVSGYRIWQAPAQISPNPGCYSGYPAALVSEGINPNGTLDELSKLPDPVWISNYVPPA